MAGRQFYCASCKSWVPANLEDGIAYQRKQHNKLCNGDPFVNHPDILELDSALEYWFGENNG